VRGRREVGGYFLKTTHHADGGSAIEVFINLYCKLEGRRIVDSDLVLIKLSGLNSAVQWFAVTCLGHKYAYIVSPF